MLEFGLIDEIIKEPVGGAHTDPEKMAKTLKAHIKKELQTLMEMSADDRITTRIEKYSKMGDFEVVDLTENKTSKKK